MVGTDALSATLTLDDKGTSVALKPIYIAAVPICLLVLGAILYFAYGWQYFTKPDSEQMRHFVLSKLTDEQIRKVYTESAQEFERHKALMERGGNEFWDERRKLMKLCQDVAYRTRNAEACSAPLPITVDEIGKPFPGYRTVDEIFNREILGVCGLANTVAKAKTFGCLP